MLKQSRPADGGSTASGWTATAVETDPTAQPWTLYVNVVCSSLNGAFS